MLRTALTSTLRLSTLRLSTVAGAVVLAVLLPVLPAQAAPSPTIASVTPTVTHVGRTLTVTGTALGGATSVALGAVDVPVFSAPDDTHLTATVPADAVTAPLSVTTAGGTATTDASITVAPAPAAVTGLSGVVGDRVVTLSWTASGTGPAVARDVTGVSGTLTTASGRALAVAGSTARDAAFTNLAQHTYAVWATDTDGTSSDLPTTVVVDPVAVVTTTLTLTASAVAVPYPRRYVLMGTLTRAGVAVAGQSVEVRSRTLGSSAARVVRRLTTATNGTVRTSMAGSRSTEHSLRFAGDAFSGPATSGKRVVRVQPRISAALVPSTIVRGESAVLSGRTTPALKAAVVHVQRKVGASWRDVAVVRTDRTGTFTHTAAPSLGVYSYRAVLSPTPSLMRAVSPVRVLRVDARDLAGGTRGADVLALQRQLASLHYDVGALDGAFGYNMTHAVMAFQKVERLPVTGRWSKAERTRIGAPRGFRLRYASPGRSVEVSLTRQVLVVAEAGRIVKVVDVSSGNDEYYTVDGVTEKAYTPRGRFSVTRKIDGVRVSRLGELYRPAYFIQGWAVHGSGSVPAYPASHGCVRVTNPAMDRLFPLLTVGTPLAVYDE